MVAWVWLACFHCARKTGLFEYKMAHRIVCTLKADKLGRSATANNCMSHESHLSNSADSSHVEQDRPSFLKTLLYRTWTSLNMLPRKFAESCSLKKVERGWGREKKCGNIPWFQAGAHSTQVYPWTSIACKIPSEEQFIGSWSLTPRWNLCRCPCMPCQCS